MASDPNLNRGGACRNPMSFEPHNDFTDLYQNEESFDLTRFVSGNLELCSDDLFENLFPPNSPLGQDPKKEDAVLDFDEELNSWYNQTPSDPKSNCASACSSAAPSPVPFNYYNTPPVTPQADKHRPVSPHHLQFDGLTTPMSASRFSTMRGEEPKNNFGMAKQWPDDAKNNFTSSKAGVLQTNNQQFSNAPVIVKPDPESMQAHPSQALVVKEEIQNSPEPFVVPGQSTSDLQSKSPLKRPNQTVHSGGISKKNKSVVKGTLEYVQKRERNNVAVRRSRDKAKQKAIETQRKVEELTSENARLHERVNELSHELTTLKNLLKSLHQVNA